MALVLSSQGQYFLLHIYLIPSNTTGHTAKYFKNQIGRQQRSIATGIKGRGDFHQVTSYHVKTKATAYYFQPL